MLNWHSLVSRTAASDKGWLCLTSCFRNKSDQDFKLNKLNLIKSRRRKGQKEMLTESTRLTADSWWTKNLSFSFQPSTQTWSWHLFFPLQCKISQSLILFLALVNGSMFFTSDVLPHLFWQQLHSYVKCKSGLTWGDLNTVCFERWAWIGWGGKCIC